MNVSTATTAERPAIHRQEAFVTVMGWWHEALADLSGERRMTALGLAATIATRADHGTGAEAWWTDRKLADATGLGHRTVRRYRAVLKAAGIVTWAVRHKPTGETYTAYRVAFDRPPDPADDAPVYRQDRTARSGVGGPVRPDPPAATGRTPRPPAAAIPEPLPDPVPDQGQDRPTAADASADVLDDDVGTDVDRVAREVVAEVGWDVPVHRVRWPVRERLGRPLTDDEIATVDRAWRLAHRRGRAAVERAALGAGR